mgnify:CR=1 FL=1
MLAVPTDPRWATTLAALVAAAATLTVLALPAVRRSRRWRATVTPLASIIGSGFLVVAPLLASAVGSWAVLAMAAIVVLAWAVGSAVRYVIAEAERIEEGEVRGAPAARAIVLLGGTAKVALAGAYLVAVAFYLHLLGAFVGRTLGPDLQLLPKLVASVLLVGIAVYGAARGLSALERIEEGAVALKLAVIAGLLAALAVFDVGLATGWGGASAAPARGDAIGWRDLRIVLGGFLVVQGFETSRFLRAEYDANLRIRTMRWAQLLAAAIYLTFVGLATPILGAAQGTGETAILDLSARLSFVLPALLTVGAVASQFSAAVADTIGAGGLGHDVSAGRIPARLAYAIVGAVGLLLVWTLNVFEVIAWASRGFALAYAAYAALAAVRAATRRTPRREPWRAAGFALLSVAMIAVALLGIPAEAA